MYKGIVLSNVLGMSRRRGDFLLPLGRPGDWCARKLEHIVRHGVCPISDDEATKVDICVSDQLTTAVCNAMALRGFGIAWLWHSEVIAAVRPGGAIVAKT